MMNNVNKNSNLDMEVEKLKNCVLSTNTDDDIASGRYLSLLVEIKQIEKRAKEEREATMNEALKRYNNVVKECNNDWSKLNGDNLIDSFEKEWTQWSIDDTINWFDFVLKMEETRYSNDKHQNGNVNINGNDYNSDSESYSDDSDSDSESGSDETSDDNHDDEKERELEKNRKKFKSNEIDFEDIKSRLEATGFRAKTDLVHLDKAFNFKQCGFKNKKDCKVLCKQTKKLIEKYPRKKQKKKKKNHIVKHQSANDEYDFGRCCSGYWQIIISCVP